MSKNIIEAKKVWNDLENVLIDDTAGTERYDIWLWIEAKYGVSIGDDLMYN